MGEGIESVPSPVENQEVSQGIQIPLDANMQKTLVNIVLSDFESAKQARDGKKYGRTAKGAELGFDEWIKELTDLYFGRREAKTIPWRFCSNRSLMIGMAIVETLMARLFPAVFNEEAVNWRPMSRSSEDRVKKLNKFMFWWVKVHCHLKDFFNEWTRIVIGYGDCVTESSLDVQLVDRAQGKQKIVRTRSDIIPKKDVYFQAGSRDIQRDPVILKTSYFYRELEQLEQEGRVMNIANASTPEIKTLKDVLPVIGAPTEGALQPDQVEEILNIKRRNTPVTCLKWYGAIDIDGDGIPEQLRVLVALDQRLYLGGVMLKDISYRGLRPIDVTQFIPRLDEPQGLMGLGVLEQVKELALEIDAIFNQMTDGNTLQVMRPGFYDPSGDLDAGALSIAPNKMSPVSNPTQNVYFPEINIPTEKLVSAITLVLEFIERVTAASAYVMGKESEIVGGSGTATRTQAIVGAANQRHAIPVDSLRRGVARILTQHLDLIQKSSADILLGLEGRIVGDEGDPLFAPNELSMDSFAGEYDAYLLPDESMGSKEMERQLGEMLYSVLTQNLIVATDPVKLYRATADFMLKPYGKDPEYYLGPPPEMAEALKPEEEHALILSGQLSKVKANILQNPLEHIMAHQKFLQSPTLAELPPVLAQQVTEFLTAHIQEHMMIMTMLTQLASKVKGQKGSNQGGTNAGGNGAQGRTTQGAQAIGPEPRMGSIQEPLARAGATQREGESRFPT